jgi:hypothetical protein
MPVITDKAAQRKREFDRLLTDVFRKAGWQVRRHVPVSNMEAHFVADTGDYRYAVALKTSSEGRPDRVIPLLSQAILEAQAISRSSPEPVVSVAVIAAPTFLPLLVST